jgi:alkanesulfonate monooxygenase SsuD/methylene tetrahydromethanopterin reductase-like flavin-dependent oxidoreductase (luciferase family)
VWVGVGGNPESVVRAGTLGLPMALAIIGGRPEDFAPLADLHRRAVAQAGHDPVPIAVHAHGYVARSTDRAADEFYPSYAHAMSVIGRERGWRPMSRPAFDAMRSRTGSLVVGDPQTVATKILAMREWLGIERFMLHISVGTLPHEQVLESIRLLGTEVAPIVRAAATSEASR